MDIDGIRIEGFDEPERIGSGATSVVYRARQSSTGKVRAVKVLLATAPDFLRRFEREREALGSLEHRAIVGIVDTGVAQTGQPYLVVEHYADGSLKDALEQGRRFSPSDVARVGLAIADGLSHAHEAGWNHRDIKPANVLVRGDEVALADFGIARADDLAETSSLDHATPHHAAPETICPDEDGQVARPTASSDVYSLVSTLYALLAGRAPFEAAAGRSDSLYPFLARLASEEPPPISRPDLDSRWAVLFAKGLGKEPAQRFGSAADLAASLRPLAGAEIEPEPPLDGTIDRSPGRRRPPTPAGVQTSDVTAGPVGGEAIAPLDQTWTKGRPPKPASPDDRSTASRHRPLLIGGAVLVTILIAIGGYFALTRPAPDEGAGAPPSTRRDSSGSTSTVDPEGTAPGDVAVDVEGPVPVVSWADATGGQYPTVLVVAVDGETPEALTAPAGRTSIEVPSIGPDDAWCVWVGTLLDGARRAWAPVQCLNGAIPPFDQPPG